MTYAKPQIVVVGRTLGLIQGSSKDTDDVTDSNMGTEYRTIGAYGADE